MAFSERVHYVMCLAINALALEPNGKCFEEVRFEDYLKSYQTTGGPPPPVPQQPTEDFQRAALGLPPLFKPQTTAGSTALTRTPTVLIDSVSVPRIVDPTQLPKGQEFSVTTNTNEKFQSIVAMSQYEFFSPEELRYYAYLQGHKTSPLAIAMDPFVGTEKNVPTASATTGDEQMQSINGKPEFSKHSFEELRIAFLLAGREVNSAEIIQLNNPCLPPPTDPTIPSVLPSTTGASLLAPGPAVPPPVFASASSSAGRFTFGSR